MLTVSSITETSKYVFFGEVGEVVENLLLCHASCQIREYIVDGDSHTSDAGLSATLVRFNRDYVFVVHAKILSQPLTVERSNASHQRGRMQHWQNDKKFALRPPLHAFVRPRFSDTGNFFYSLTRSTAIAGNI